MGIRVCIAGATGWVGRELVSAVMAAPDLSLSGAVARGAAGAALGGVIVAPTLGEALGAPSDVVVDYTKPDAVKAHVLTALAHGCHVVIGTSGLTAEDYAEIDEAARRAGRGVVAAGNFSVTAALMQRFTLIAAAFVPDVEVIDYAGASRPDVPSGTARELAERLESARCGLGTARPIDGLHGPANVRGASVRGTRVHSLRLPGYVLSCEAVLGLSGERLTIRHDAGSGAEPYVAGTLLAIRRAPDVTGLVRGMDRLMFGDF
ncbi:4-hydroxy-tetrahydrodipicolinate reductase [Arenibaculum pallidiluteum]|uniref:4-hydroxy-tetrahydrodipicolinate reductase n=1 Tax=Arenibaculum pallidiluteum TaxID=2812559 RepID=UPI001A9605F7|nr:4-hydroxy-tetrahydrodipicolinate reductase [Arenibaculum pallidiluteum]